jgi:hypothetical protein
MAFPVTRDGPVLNLSRPLADQQLVSHKAPTRQLTKGFEDTRGARRTAPVDGGQ